MKNQQETKITILSEILHHNREEAYDDKDDFVSRLSSTYLTNLHESGNVESFLKKSSKLHTNFFKYNKIKKSTYLETIFNKLSKRKSEIVLCITKPAISIYDLFPEIKKIKDREISDVDKKLDIKEEIIQNALREAFRKKNASPIARRSKDSSLEVADIEHFHAKIRGRSFSFAVVVKGYRSLKGSKSSSRKVNWEDISHQVTKAYSRTKPDCIIVVSAREPVDSLVSEMVSYGASVGNEHLIIFVPPMDLAKFLIWRGILNLKTKRKTSIKKVFQRRKDTDRTPWPTWTMITHDPIFSHELPAYLTNGNIHRFSLNRKSMSLIVDLHVEKNGHLNVELDRYLIDSKTSLQNDKSFTVIIDGDEIKHSEKLGEISRVLSIPIKKDTTKVEIVGTEIEGISYLGVVKKENIITISNSKGTVSFAPKMLKVKLGDKIRWQNNDKKDHSVISGLSQKRIDVLFNSLITPYNWFEVSFSIPGKYPYFCSIHPREKGSIVVEKIKSNVSYNTG